MYEEASMAYTSSADWQFDIPTSGSKRLPPAARYVESLTHQGYGFEAAIADLIDTSIDAGARNVVISFLRDSDRLVSLLVVDEGHEMNDEALDTTMTVGGREGYSASALGHFGAGLKAASPSHAESLTVVSRAKRSPAAGRRWLTSHAQADVTCDIVDPPPDTPYVHQLRRGAVLLYSVADPELGAPAELVTGGQADPAKIVMAAAFIPATDPMARPAPFVHFRTIDSAYEGQAIVEAT
ncbi:ATP-binding protein [Streptomyces scopuliridis]|uniref:ATP-binding protein n=1 Tax=Streptomyces scopuliridis TaxID=452529 RepID=UPI0036CB0B91